MRQGLAWGVIACSVLGISMACGGRTDLGGNTIEETTDASTDAKPPKKDATPDVGPDVYVPIGTKCVRDAGAPPVWTPGDAGVPLHPPLEVNAGGPVLALPTLIPMTFDGDDLRDQLEDFIASVGCSAWWRTVASDYGIGQAVMGTPVHLSEKAPTTIDDTQIGVWLRNKILQKAVPDAVQNETLYVIYYPDTTQITLQGEVSCQAFGGYHSSVQMSDGRDVPYAVLPRCGSFGGLGGLDSLTATSSHELIEAATDPLSNYAYVAPEPLGIAWALGNGGGVALLGEVADLCTFNDNAFFLPNDYPFYVQRSWVNRTTWVGQDPCQPTTDTFFASAAVMPDLLPYDFGFGPQQAAGVKIAVNAGRTIDVKLISGAPWTDLISVQAVDVAQFSGQGKKLNFNLNPSSGHVGDTLKLTINRVGTNQQIGMEPFLLRAQSQGRSTSWWGLVGDP